MACECGYLPVDYLQDKFGKIEDENEKAIFIAGNLLPREDICDAIKSLCHGSALISEERVLAFSGQAKDFFNQNWENIEFKGQPQIISYVFDIFLKNPAEIEYDFKQVVKDRKSQAIPDCTRIIGNSVNDDGSVNIFIEEGAEVECATINLKDGPVYIGKDAIVMEGSCLKGPLAVCESSEIRMGAKIYGGSTFGPHCKMGGEIDNTVVFGYSNKAHDGYLGNAVIGEWCNIGAGVNASNLKNDYSKIRVWNYRTKTFMRTELQFCGLIMGDHSKIGVNCMLNTATVIGVGVNLHGTGFPRVFIPSFSEGSPGAGFNDVTRKKFQEIADIVMSRREIEMDENERKIYDYIFENVKQFK